MRAVSLDVEGRGCAAGALENGIKHIRCGSSDDPALTEAGKAIAAQGPRENVFVSAKLRPNERASKGRWPDSFSVSRH